MSSLVKKIWFTFSFLLCFTIAVAQVPVDNIRNSMGSGNIVGVSKYFDNAIVMTIGGSQSTYSRSQAEMVLRDFFSKNSPKAFNMEHSGGNHSLKYAIGTLVTNTGNYRAYFSVRQKGNAYVIQEIRIEK